MQLSSENDSLELEGRCPRLRLIRPCHITSCPTDISQQQPTGSLQPGVASSQRQPLKGELLSGAQAVAGYVGFRQLEIHFGGTGRNSLGPFEPGDCPGGVTLF